MRVLTHFLKPSLSRAIMLRKLQGTYMIRYDRAQKLTSRLLTPYPYTNKEGCLTLIRLGAIVPHVIIVIPMDKLLRQ